MRYSVLAILLLFALTFYAQPVSPYTVVAGAIEGSGGPGGLGGATYTIPIKVPEGLGGIQPSIAVAYNNQGNNGLLGWCWDLQGVSSITRVGTTPYHDGGMGGVDFDNDRFALDGQRLMCVSGSYGANNAEYRTEMDCMAKIVSYTCDTTYGPAWFKVWLPNGNIAYYGNSEDSRIGLRQPHDACLWLLNRLEDRNGNYMECHYVRGDASYRLSRIDYGGNDAAGIPCCYSVRLFYSTRNDVEMSFIGDNTLKQDGRLDSIQVKRGTHELHKYRFGYHEPDAQNGYYYNRLEQVGFSCGNETYNPTVIQWGSNDYGNYGSSQCHGIVVAGGSVSDLNGKIKFTGDLNGDGFADLIVYNPDSKDHKTAVVYINNGMSGNGDLRLSKLYTVTLDDHIDWIYTTDLNGDGLDDLVLSNRKRTLIGKDKLTLDAYLSSVDSTGSYHYSAVPQSFGEFRIKKKYRETILVGDFLGEGRQSLLLQECDDGKASPRLFYITYSGGSLSAQQLPQDMVLDADRMFACDFNGDGISEIYYMNEETVSTGLLRMAPSGSSFAYQTVNNHMLTPWHQLFPGDFNGDGKPDLLTYAEDGNGNSSWYLNYFKESSLRWPEIVITEQTVGIGNPGTHGYSLKHYDEADYKFITVGDFNGDGKADVAVRTQDNQMRFLYGPVKNVNGQGQFSGTQTVSLSAIGMGGATNQTICAGNFLGHENLGMFSASTLHTLNPVSNRYSVVRVTDGMGNRTEFEYDYLMAKPAGATDTDFYTREVQTGDEQKASIFTVPLPMKAMSRMTAYNTDCPTPLTEVAFRYSDATVHKRGRGFLGFKSSVTEHYLGSALQQTVQRLMETKLSVPSLALRTELTRRSDGAVVSSTEYENVVLKKRDPSTGTIFNKVYVPVVKTLASLSYDIGDPQTLLNKTIVRNSYNDTLIVTINGIHFSRVHTYGILKQTGMAQGVDSSASVQTPEECEFQTITQTRYVAESQDDIQGWVVNRPYSVRTTARRLGGYSDVKSLTVNRYPSTGNPFLPSCVENYPNGAENPLDSLATYDSTLYSPTGSVTLKTQGDIAAQLTPRRWRYCYSDDGRFLTEQTNPAGHSTYYSHDPDYGYVISETDCNGLVTLHSRSPLGSSFSTAYPDGRVSQGGTECGVTDEYAPDGTMYFQWSTSSGKGLAKTYYNALGQRLRELSQGMESEIVLKDYAYNERGLLSMESLPYFFGDSDIQWTRYRYDEYGRLIVTEYPDRVNIVQMYDGNTTYIVSYLDDPDCPRVTSSTVNAAGWTVISTDEEWNEVRYDHYADGKLMTAQLGSDGGTAISVGYDAAGNRTTLTDPNYGTVVSEYDAFGQLVRTVNPSGEETSYEYDILGRMVKRYERNRLNNSVDSTLWHYSEFPGTLGLLTGISFNGKEQAFWYAYDSLCRVTAISEMRKTDYYTTAFTYDSLSRLSNVTYPSGVTMSKEYTATGHLRTLRGGHGELLWETVAKNAMGQVTQYQTGDGMTTERSYNPLTGRLAGILTYNLTDTIQNLSYVFDKSANLASRKDNLRNMEERFAYDWLDRLTGIIEDGDTTGAFAYDAYGRMVSKRLHGCMVFDSTSYGLNGRPHAIDAARMYSRQPDVSIDYTSFDKLQQIQFDNFTLSYDYGYDHQRVRMVETLNNDTVFTKEYVGACEFVVDKDGQSSTLTYLSGPLGVFAVLDSHILPVGKGMYYVHPDHLGSWTTVTSRNGSVVQDVRFDPWGTPYYSDSANLVQANFLFFDRGFTGHEHLLDFGLVNMNGRVYDPVTSTFLSVDNYVQDPSYTQNFNRYAYCLNNPLKYTDPDGELFWIIPSIGWSKESGLSLGLTFAAGLPGLWSAQASVGYSISSQTIYGSAGVTCAGVTGYVSAGYSMKNEQITASIGVTAGLSPYSGVPVSTNFFTVGASYDYTYSKTLGGSFSFTGQLSAWSYNFSAKKWHFNPSISAMVFPEHTTNLVRGQGFQSNNKVLQHFVANGQYQQALDYFGFEGSYDPNCSDPGQTDRKSLTITYGDEAFKYGYDYLYLVADHEQRHLANFKSDKYAKYDGKLDELTHHEEEWSVYLYNYKRQGLYPEHGVDLCKRINNEGFNAGIYEVNILPNGQNYMTGFSSEWWHFVYRIPRIY